MKPSFESWLDAHPATASYFAVVATILLVLLLNEVLNVV